MLDKQINMYSVDTGHFYSNHEKYLHEMNCKYRKERNYSTLIFFITIHSKFFNLISQPSNQPLDTLNTFQMN